MNELKIEGKARGEFKLIVTRGDGSKEELKFPNMLLDNSFASVSAVFSYCTAGSGTTPPAGTDTQLVSRLGSNLSSSGSSQELSTTFVGSIATVARKTTMVFAAGGVIGNVSELAIYANNTISAASIRARALVTDVNGDPTTITLEASDQLTVEHTIYVDIETRPTPTVMNIKGTGHTVSVVVGWPEFYTVSSTDFSATNLPHISNTGGTGRIAEVITVGSVGSKVRPSYSGAQYNATPSISYDNSTPAAGVKKVTTSISIPTSTQLAGGVPIGGIAFGSSAANHTIAVLFDPPLPKNSTVGYTFSLTATLARV